MNYRDRLYLFRVDFSPEIGGGHFSRCALLAKQLLMNQCRVAFVCRDTDSARNSNIYDLEGVAMHYIEDVRDEAFDAMILANIISNYSQSKVYVVLDSYELGSKWVKNIRKYVDKIAILDDLSSTFFDCDLVICQSPFLTSRDYASKVGFDCKVLAGPLFLIVRPEFTYHKITNYPRGEGNAISRIHLMAGAGNSSVVIKELFLPFVVSNNSFNFILNIPSDPAPDLMDKLRKIPNLESIVNSPCIAKDMSECQLAIGTPGISTWERACVGLPSIQFGTCVNKAAMDSQDLIMRKLHQANVCIWLGKVDRSTPASIMNTFHGILNCPSLLYPMHESCTALIDGNGLYRVTRELLKL